MNPPAATPPAPASQRCEPLFGILTRAGSLIVNEEADCALVISMTPDALRAAKSLPMYRRVAVVDADIFEAHYVAYLAALEDHLDSVGLQLAQQQAARVSAPKA